MPGTGCGGKTRWPGTCANVRLVISADTIPATKNVRIWSPLSRPGKKAPPQRGQFLSEVSWRFREGTDPGYASRRQKTTRLGPIIGGIFSRNVAWRPFRHKRDCPKPSRGPLDVRNQGQAKFIRKIIHTTASRHGLPSQSTDCAPNARSCVLPEAS